MESSGGMIKGIGAKKNKEATKGAHTIEVPI